jgi:hypothetical protein
MVIHFFILFLFLLDSSKVNSVSKLFYGVTYTFIIAELVDLGIALYIIFLKKQPSNTTCG